MRRTKSHYHGCLIGGAIGDAFGAPVEFMSYEKIVMKYGEEGIRNLTLPYDGNKALITDDTQLTLFTAEGLLRSITRAKTRGITREVQDTAAFVYRAYLRWLYTQGLKTPVWNQTDYDGWLIKVKALYAYREPGVTCITTLGKGVMGTMDKPLNDSKSCGAVMRVAPVGLTENEEDVFDVASSIAAITHGHKTGFLAAGTFASIIYYIIEGFSLNEAINKAIERLKEKEGHEECLTAITKAIQLAESKEKPSYETIRQLGYGFSSEEALAIGIYCALVYQDDFKNAIILAVNHDGDSDSTGAITGNILGAYLGIEKIESQLIEFVELSKEIQELSYDLYNRYEESEEWLKKYPCW